MDEVANEEYDEDVESNIIQQLTEFNNPFLLKALEGHIPPELVKKDITDSYYSDVQNTQTGSRNLFERYLYY